MEKNEVVIIAHDRALLEQLKGLIAGRSDWKVTAKTTRRIKIQSEMRADVNLTRRETEILHFLARGLSYAEIAELLFVSSHTVTSHIQNIYRKLDVKSRSEAVFEAVKQNLIAL